MAAGRIGGFNGGFGRVINLKNSRFSAKKASSRKLAKAPQAKVSRSIQATSYQKRSKNAWRNLIQIKNNTGFMPGIRGSAIAGNISDMNKNIQSERERAMRSGTGNRPDEGKIRHFGKMGYREGFKTSIRDAIQMARLGTQDKPTINSLERHLSEAQDYGYRAGKNPRTVRKAVEKVREIHEAAVRDRQPPSDPVEESKPQPGFIFLPVEGNLALKSRPALSIVSPHKTRSQLPVKRHQPPARLAAQRLYVSRPNDVLRLGLLAPVRSSYLPPVLPSLSELVLLRRTLLIVERASLETLPKDDLGAKVEEQSGFATNGQNDDDNGNGGSGV